MAAPPLQLLPVAPSLIAWNGHRIALYRAGEGPPVLLIHSINAAASVFEMRAPFRGLRDAFSVFAVDLLGYGNSDRPARSYVAEDYIAQIGAVLERIGAPTTLIASSLGAAYAIMAADRWPERVKALVLVCPTGLQQLADPAGPAGWATYRALSGPLGRGLYASLTSRASIALFLRLQAYHDPRCITPETIDGFYLTCRRAGAYYAPICFLAGLLNCSVREAFPRLRQPILIVWGKQSVTTPLRQADAFLAANGHARLAVIDKASQLAQDEHPEQFNAMVRMFLATLQ